MWHKIAQIQWEGKVRSQVQTFQIEAHNALKAQKLPSIKNLVLITLNCKLQHPESNNESIYSTAQTKHH